MNCETSIEQWIAEYLPDHKIELSVETMESSGVLGRCTASKYSDGSIKSTIYVNSLLATGGIMERSIAWHEYTHLQNFAETGAMGHGSEFWRKALRKPVLLMAVYVMFPFVIYKMIKG